MERKSGNIVVLKGKFSCKDGEWFEKEMEIDTGNIAEAFKKVDEFLYTFEVSLANQIFSEEDCFKYLTR